tara:strand:- start:208 stop:543 length:336 start_codon:yes stop_codon:yes gene_type:complete
MFKDLFSFNKERQALEALGFYIVYFIIGLILGVTSVYIFDANSYESGLVVGQVLAFFYCLFLGYLILSQKRQLNTAYLALLPLIAISAYFLGALGGLVPVAYLSTIKSLES